MIIFSAPYSTAISATWREPTTLTKTASQGFSSIKGTCLYAAAWNTIWGWYFSKTIRSLWIDRTSPITGTKSIPGYFFSNSKRTLWRGVSAESKRISLRTPFWASCRQSSLPILPAAPVTKIVFSEYSIAISCILILISSRPNKSSIRIGRTNWWNKPSTSVSLMDGAIRVFTLFILQYSSKRFSSSLTNSLRAKRIPWIWRFLINTSKLAWLLKE